MLVTEVGLFGETVSHNFESTEQSLGAPEQTLTTSFCQLDFSSALGSPLLLETQRVAVPGTTTRSPYFWPRAVIPRTRVVSKPEVWP